MEAALVSVGTGVMKPLLSKIYNLLKEEHSKFKGVRRQIEETKDEMSGMEAALEVLADAEQLDAEMRAWKEDVRELSYDMEDCVDDFIARVDHERGRSTGLKGFFDKLKKLKPRHEIAGEIERLKARAIEASKRHKRYKLDRQSPGSTTTCDIDPRLHALYVEVGELVGIKGPREHILEWFKSEASSTQLRVVSIVGPGGLGKTTLANAVFETIKSEFSCSALVSVSRKPNMKNILRDIAERVRVEDYTYNDDERQLIDKLREHLRNKKYLIVIDDIWDTEAWKTISHALLNNNNGSRIITTTRNSTVASFCSSQGDYVYRLEPLNFADSRRLFLERAFRYDCLCPPHLKEILERILEKCAGLPLAIITMSGLLADQTAEEEWNRALAAIGSSLAKEPDAGDMTKILSLSYFDLPHPMRTCLLYLSAFPEDYIIEKHSLIYKWIAEGFVCEVRGRSTYEVGESYFNDFINRSLIQPAKLMDNGQVVACRVHDIILDFITCMAKEENFMTSFGDAEQGKKHKVRRLSVMSRKYEMATMSSWDLSHVRSLATFGSFGQNSLVEFPALRVLDLGECEDLQSHHLENIEKLLLLKYLRLRIAEIPEGIGKLKYLETLDMRGMRIRKLPSTMTRLQRLTRLYTDLDPSCLSDGIIGQLQSLEELENVFVPDAELERFLRELGQLSKLRKLSVNVTEAFDSKEKEDAVRFIGTLISSYNIHLLRITYGPNLPFDPMPDLLFLSLEPWCPANPAAFRKIWFANCYIDKIPSWMVSLVNLRNLDICMYRTGPEDVAVLGGIPALAFLTLETWYGRNGRIFIRGFRSLKYFKLEVKCCGTAVEFEEGSMPMVEHLQLGLKGHNRECVNYATDFGIQHLSTLTKVDINIDGNNGKIKRLIETALRKLRYRLTLSASGERCNHFEELFTELYFRKAGSSVQQKREGAFCSFLDRVFEEINQDALSRLMVLDVQRAHHVRSRSI
ncbi:disease resistance protein RGA5-like [Triticum dicoccoides]|uniref:disease resistance protein RGA5-like n=1 Tax=Triticum dicoccoides TaxID=85692 RepID=UPI001891AD66|nr:disease resistance protein RGA5-like [Triticum dicoccoides]